MASIIVGERRHLSEEHLWNFVLNSLTDNTTVSKTCESCDDILVMNFWMQSALVIKSWHCTMTRSLSPRELLVQLVLVLSPFICGKVWQQPMDVHGILSSSSHFHPTIMEVADIDPCVKHYWVVKFQSLSNK